jgi:hypothetical protein
MKNLIIRKTTDLPKLPVQMREGASGRILSRGKTMFPTVFTFFVKQYLQYQLFVLNLDLR